MGVSVRSLLMSGVSVVGATAIAIAPMQAPPPEVTAHANTPVRVVSNDFVELLAAVQPAAAPGDPVALNAAGDAIVDAWNRALPWIDYWVELAAYVVDFIPFGFELADQIDIFYFSLIRPIANSFVVDLVAPVVSDPLNLDSYIDGLSALGTTTVNSLWNFAVTEFYFFFGWLIPPIPPLPPLQAAVEAPAMQSKLANSLPADEEDTTVPENAEGAGEVEEEAAEGAETTEETTEETEKTGELEETEEVLEETEEVDETEELKETTSTNGTVAAQGEVRGSGVDATDPADEGTDLDDTSLGDNKEIEAEAPSVDATESGDAGDGADAGDGGQS